MASENGFFRNIGPLIVYSIYTHGMHNMRVAYDVVYTGTSVGIAIRSPKSGRELNGRAMKAMDQKARRPGRGLCGVAAKEHSGERGEGGWQPQKKSWRRPSFLFFWLLAPPSPHLCIYLCFFFFLPAPPHPTAQSTSRPRTKQTGLSPLTHYRIA